MVECCQVVAEKGGVALSPASRAATSLIEGGGERGRLPARTATDQNGAVSGYRGGNYGKKGGGASAMQPIQMPTPTHAAGAPQRPAAPAYQPPAASPPSAPPPAPAMETPRHGALRFSSLSGFRRR